LGIGRLMGRVFLRAAKDLQYKSRWVQLSWLHLVSTLFVLLGY
jgi:hypothetical protein